MLILVIAIVRFFPFIVRLIQATAIGARAFWWLIFPVLVVSWICWWIFRRGTVAKKSEHQIEGQRIRDVTGSAEENILDRESL